jgi:hypothetical protein
MDGVSRCDLTKFALLPASGSLVRLVAEPATEDGQIQCPDMNQGSSKHGS